MYQVNDKVITKKSHPCGKNIWTIIRTGADYKLKCDGCGRIVLLSPDELKKRCKSVIPFDGSKNE